MVNDTWVTSDTSGSMILLGVVEVLHLSVVAFHLILLGVETLHFKVLGVDVDTVLAAEGVHRGLGVHLHLVLVHIIAVLELGGVVIAQIFSNSITMRNDTRFTSIPS